jgi:hypothetical protein
MRNLQFWRSKWIVVSWLVSLVLVGLNIFTPVELVPLSLENVPRWGIYALVWAAASTLAPRALPLADSAVARLGTAAGRALFLAADDGGPNTDQVLVGHLRTCLGIRQPKRKRVSKE